MPLSRLSIGTTGTGSATTATVESDASWVRLLQSARDLGVNCFDTAELYGGGHAERLLGQAFQTQPESVFICSKCSPGNARRAALARAVDGSLARLGRDYIDLYLLHWPNPFVPFEETWDAMEPLIEAGKIRAAGLGNCSVSELHAAWRISRGGLRGLEVGYSIWDREIESTVLPWIEGKNLTLLAYSPLGQGRVLPAHADEGELRSLCRTYGATPAQLMLSWSARHPQVTPVVRTRNLSHLRENIAAMDLVLAPADCATLSALFATPRASIAIDQIDILAPDDRPLYATAIEAQENRFDWIPSPELLAERIRRGSVPSPLRVNRAGPRFRLDTYDFQGEMKKYWAWRLASGDATAVPVLVMNPRDPR